jgi:hypothetical protein
MTEKNTHVRHLCTGTTASAPCERLRARVRARSLLTTNRRAVDDLLGPCCFSRTNRELQVRRWYLMCGPDRRPMGRRLREDRLRNVLAYGALAGLPLAARSRPATQGDRPERSSAVSRMRGSGPGRGVDQMGEVGSVIRLTRPASRKPPENSPRSGVSVGDMLGNGNSVDRGGRRSYFQILNPCVGA